MFTRNQPDEHNVWISFADLFSGFMVIFIVVSLALFQRDTELEQAKYHELATVFKNKLESSSIRSMVSVADNATIRFATDNVKSALFLDGDANPQPKILKAIDVFIPIFYGELQKFYKESKQKDAKFEISEVRIEGHTNQVGSYLFNLNLSSNRALEVQKYIINKLENDGNFSKSFVQFIKMNSISCGYSFSRMLDSKGNLTQSKPDTVKSKRVEFRILLRKK
ncbi:MAG: OmpA family protein [Sphingobacteriales bacterium]|nr:MAG: OmpA family protein [Sphingobacteriales bacterium]